MRISVPQQIRSVDLQAGDIPSFHIRQMKSFTYPSAKESPEVPHRHNFHELIWIHNGTGEQDIDGRKEDIQPQTFYLIGKGQVHQFIRADRIDGMVVRFTADFIPGATRSTRPLRGAEFLTRWFKGIAGQYKLHVGGPDSTEFSQWFELMTREFENPPGPGRHDVLGHLLQILLIKLDKCLLKQSRRSGLKDKGNNTLFQDFLAKLEENYHTLHEVNQYADSLHVTPRQLSAITKRHAGKTAKQMINERLVLEAKQHLKFTNISVKEVAFCLDLKIRPTSPRCSNACLVPRPMTSDRTSRQYPA